MLSIFTRPTTRPRPKARAPWIAVLAIVSLALGALPAQADLANSGGPVLKSFEIVPYYYGPWKSSDIASHQSYLVGLAAYISGANAPANSQTMLVQYGVTSAGAANPVTKTSVSAPSNWTTDQALTAIHDAQKAGTLPQYSTNRVILLLLPTGATLKEHCAYHGAEAVGKYYAFVTQDCGPWLQVTAHEILEAATDPAIGFQNAWDEAVDPCGTSFPLWFGPVPGVFDNSKHACSTTGYDSKAPVSIPGSFTAVWQPSTQPEIQVNGWTYDAYRQKYDELWGVGWRLHLLQPYVVNGQVLYNAVWRPGTESEVQVYGWKYQDYRNKYDQLWGQGWRLKILQPYVVNGQVLYTAVWRPSTEGETQVYGWKYQDYRNKYDQLWAQGWRLKLLQPFVVNGQVLYTAVWRPAVKGEIQVYGWSNPDYLKKYDALSPTGWRLQLLQAY
ncbi:MAG: hypothetical protein QOF89_6152 [Acidobacteriota bacterium]|jgi:hypothetical protein|nr:hypothetical protein [Acidobacteriota bacterium]